MVLIVDVIVVVGVFFVVGTFGEFVFVVGAVVDANGVVV